MNESIKSFFEIKEINSRKVRAAIRPMTKDQARETYPYRPHGKGIESRFGGNELSDDRTLLLNELAKRCIMCQAPTRNEFLVNNTCPDCNGRAEYNYRNPHNEIESK